MGNQGRTGKERFSILDIVLFACALASSQDIWVSSMVDLGSGLVLEDTKSLDLHCACKLGRVSVRYDMTVSGSLEMM